MNTPETEKAPYRRGHVSASVTLLGLSWSMSFGHAGCVQSAWQASHPGSPAC